MAGRATGQLLQHGTSRARMNQRDQKSTLHPTLSYGSGNLTMKSVEGSVKRTIVFDSAEDVVDIEWEESARVKHGLDESGNGSEGHIFGVCVAVPL